MPKNSYLRCTVHSPIDKIAKVLGDVPALKVVYLSMGAVFLLCKDGSIRIVEEERYAIKIDLQEGDTMSKKGVVEIANRLGVNTLDKDTKKVIIQKIKAHLNTRKEDYGQKKLNSNVLNDFNRGIDQQKI